MREGEWERGKGGGGGCDCCIYRQAQVFYYKCSTGRINQAPILWLLHVSTSILLPGSTRFLFWDIFICPKATGRITLWDSIVCIQATGRISQVHSLKQHCMHPSYWQDQPTLDDETALCAPKLLAGSFSYETAYCMHRSYWQDQPGSFSETALYAPNLLAGSARFTLWDSIVHIQATGRSTRFTLWGSIVCTKTTGRINVVFETVFCMHPSYWQQSFIFMRQYCMHPSY